MRRLATSIHTAFALFALSRLALGQQPDGSLPIHSAAPKSGTAVENPTPYSTNAVSGRFVIWWNDTPGIDGDFNFFIQPNQVLLVSAHKNPNPSFIYWVCALDNDQYAAIVARLDRGPPAGLLVETQLHMPGYTLFRLDVPLESPRLEEGKASPEQLRAWELQSDAAVSKNLSQIVAVLNREIRGTKAIACKTSIDEKGGRQKVEE